MASKKRTDGDGSIYQRHGAGCPSRSTVGTSPRASAPGSASTSPTGATASPSAARSPRSPRRPPTRKLAELKEQHAAGTLPVGRAPTVEQWLNVWLEQIAPNRVRPTTMQLYRSRVHNRLIPLLGSHRLDRLRPEHVEKAWAHLLGERGLSSGSVLVDHRILSRALTVALQRGLVRQNVATLIDAPSARTDAPGRAHPRGGRPHPDRRRRPEAQRGALVRRVLPRPATRGGARPALVRRRPRHRHPARAARPVPASRARDSSSAP